MVAVADLEDGVELLERQVLGLGQQEVAEDPADQVPRAVVAEGARVPEGVNEGQPAEADDEVEAPGNGGGTVGCVSLARSPLSEGEEVVKRGEGAYDGGG